MTADVAWSRGESLHSRSRLSSQSTFTEAHSASPSPWDSARHSRFPSSSSSVSSSPNLRSSLDSFVPNRKFILEGLPEIDEDAHQEPHRSQSPEPQRSPSWLRSNITRARPNSFFQDADVVLQRNGYLSDHEGHWSKRRRSNDSWNSFTTGVAEKFPSLSKRNRQRKRASMSCLDTRVEFTPSIVSPRTLARSGSMRSLGRVPSVRDLEAQVAEQNVDIDDEEHQPPMDDGEPQTAPGQIENMMQDLSNEPALHFDHAEYLSDAGAEIETELRTTTPILPPLMGSKPQALLDATSPLQSPTVATDIVTEVESYTPDGTPEQCGITSPSISARPSVASIHKSHVTSTSQIPPLVLVDPADEWADKLGHANFTILPEPYVPEFCDEISCQNLVRDWEKARDEFAKHRARTETHFGGSSRTFRLTEKKWNVVDAQWKANNELATRRAIENGRKPDMSRKEPAPVAKIPLIDDPRLLQSEDIPGPMRIEEPIRPISFGLGHKTSKRAQLLKLFGGFQFPGKTLTRSTAVSVGR